MIIDANANLGRSLYGPELSASALLARIEANGIARAVVSPFTPPDLDFRRAPITRSLKRWRRIDA